MPCNIHQFCSEWDSQQFKKIKSLKLFAEQMEYKGREFLAGNGNKRRAKLNLKYAKKKKKKQNSKQQNPHFKIVWIYFSIVNNNVT